MRNTRIMSVLPNLLLIALGLAIVTIGVGLAARNLWVGLLIIVIGLGGPGFEVLPSFGRALQSDQALTVRP